MRNRFPALLLLATLVPLAVAPVWAQTPPSLAQGLAADSIYLHDGIESINGMNGAATLRIALPSYPVSPVFSFGLTVTHNTNPWRGETRTCTDFNEEGVEYELPVVDERLDPNAGHGWMVTLGRLDLNADGFGAIKGFYTSSDGATHTLLEEIHPGHPVTTDPEIGYSVNGTYLRLRLGSACGGGSCAEVDFPDGRIQRFEPSGGEYRLVEVRDRFGNSLTVSYPDDYTWKISDNHGRTHFVYFRNDRGPFERIDRIELEKFDSATPSTFQFRYLDSTVIDRYPYPNPICDRPPAETEAERVLTTDLLSQIELPDGSVWKMTHDTEDSLTTMPGAIATLTYPTGGLVEYDYHDFLITTEPQERYDYPSSAQAHLPISGVRGVGVKTMIDRDGTELGAWTYSQAQPQIYAAGEGPGGPGHPGQPCFTVTTLLDPAGNETEMFFDTTRQYTWSNGAPFTRCDPDLAAGTTGVDVTGTSHELLLSQRVYQGSGASRTLLRSVYLRYGSNGPLNGSYQDRNLRVEAQRVVYHDDGDRWTETEWSDFDGLGHFRSEKRSSNFPGSVNRTSITTYNPGAGTLAIDPDTSLPEAGNTFSVPAASAAWVIQSFDKRRVLEDGLETRAEYCFRANGLLRAQRVLAQETHSPNDLLSVYAHTDGFLTRDLSHGGDTAVNLPLGYTDLCDASLPPASEAEFRTDHSWSHGSLATSHAIDPCDSGSVLRLVDRTIDPATGLVASARDPADVSMSFEYDALGRLTAERPDFDAWTRYSYQLPTLADATLEPRVTVEQCNKNSPSSCTALTFSRHAYDGFGRPIREERTLPEINGVATHQRTHTYNALGWKLSESVWSSPGNNNATVFLGHDPFGRPSTVTLPDGTSTTFAYRGDRIVTRGATVALIAAAGGGEPPIFTTETRDQHGRLVAVCEGQSEDGQGVCDEIGAVETTYAYDRNDQLVKVCSAWSGATCTQERFFDVDGRGLLTAERHPEVGPSGNGWTYFFYDARGNVIEKDVAGTSDFDLAYAYDRAERLVGVDQVKNGVFRPLKELSYARDNLVDEKRAGKLVLAKRYNHRRFVSPLESFTEPLTLTVSQRYRYDSGAGRVAERQTRYQLNATTYAFTTQFTWDQLGNPFEINYPRCLHGDCAGQDPPRTLEHTYEEGYLRTIPGIAEKLSYQAGGMLGRVKHANGIAHSYVIDPSGMARPLQVKTDLAGTVSWASGQYDFDGAGNITEIGSRSYRYDLLNRLGSGQTENGAQTVSYDPVGNITKLVTNAVTQSTTTSSTTNRLTGLGAAYDAGGNLTSITLAGQQQVFEYDALNLMRSMETSSDLARAFVYDAHDERIATLECVPPNTCATNLARDTWTIRDLAGKVLRTYEHQWEGNTWTWERDYVYRDGVPMASIEPAAAGGETIHHLHVDHLGSIREITDAAGARVAYHSYYPFGGEAMSTGSDEVKLKFTGHERDESGGVALDYMHARYCSPVTGRFLGVDPARSAQPGSPQSWNRYSYVLNNPVKFVDPDGRCAAPAGLKAGQVGICIESFIAAKRIGGVGFGDNRGFERNNPDSTFRTSLRMVVDPQKGQILSSSERAGVSEVGLLDPMVGVPGTTSVSGEMAPGVDGQHNLSLFISGSNGFSALNNLGNINILANMTIDSSGNVSLDRAASATKGFPSIEGYAYRLINGVMEIKTLFERLEEDPDALNGLMDRRLE